MAYENIEKLNALLSDERTDALKKSIAAGEKQLSELMKKLGELETAAAARRAEEEEKRRADEARAAEEAAARAKAEAEAAAKACRCPRKHSRWHTTLLHRARSTYSSPTVRTTPQ